MIGEKTEIYLVRHGQSQHNARQLIAGQLDSELTEQGMTDARLVAQAIGRSDFDLVYSSDLLRSRQTAQVIVESLQITTPIVLSPLVRELDYGEFTGKKVIQAMEYFDYKQARDRRYSGGESYLDLQQRVSAFLTHLRKGARGKRVLVTAHAGSIRMIIILLDSLNRETYLKLTFGNRYLGKAVLDEKGDLLSYSAISDVLEEHGLRADAGD
jgi:broad specificity phosphatase PhoE